MLTVIGSPLLPFVDAIAIQLSADATFLALSSNGLFSALPRAARVLPPYTLLGRREFDDAGGAMQLDGGQARLEINVWSAADSPAEAQAIQSRIRALLLRQSLPLSGGFVMVAGSLTCASEHVDRDFDSDMPERTLFHGVQEWTAWLEGAI